MEGPSLENAMIRLLPPPTPQIATDGFAAEKKRLKEIECITCAGSAVAVQRLQELEVDIGCTAEEMQV